MLNLAFSTQQMWLHFNGRVSDWNSQYKVVNSQMFNVTRSIFHSSLCSIEGTKGVLVNDSLHWHSIRNVTQKSLKYSSSVSSNLQLLPLLKKIFKLEFKNHYEIIQKLTITLLIPILFNISHNWTLSCSILRVKSAWCIEVLLS